MADIDMEQDPDPQALQSLRTACEGAGAGFSAVVLNAVQAVVTDLQRAHAADLQALRDEFYHDRDTQTKQLNSSIEDLAADIHDIQASLLSLHEEVASLNNQIDERVMGDVHKQITEHDEQIDSLKQQQSGFASGWLAESDRARNTPTIQPQSSFSTRTTPSFRTYSFASPALSPVIEQAPSHTPPCDGATEKKRTASQCNSETSELEAATKLPRMGSLKRQPASSNLKTGPRSPSAASSSSVEEEEIQFSVKGKKIGLLTQLKSPASKMILRELGQGKATALELLGTIPKPFEPVGTMHSPVVEDADTGVAACASQSVAASGSGSTSASTPAGVAVRRSNRTHKKMELPSGWIDPYKLRLSRFR